jgi:hypothetical protein
VKQIIYLQNDFTAYKIGNIMFNLANPIAGAPGAPVPIPGADVGLKHFRLLNDANFDFAHKITEAKAKNDTSRAFYISPDESFVDFDPGRGRLAPLLDIGLRVLKRGSHIAVVGAEALVVEELQLKNAEIRWQRAIGGWKVGRARTAVRRCCLWRQREHRGKTRRGDIVKNAATELHDPSPN